MIIEQYNTHSGIAGQRLLYKTILFNKTYFWLKDIDGTHYLLPEGEDGKPDFTA